MKIFNISWPMVIVITIILYILVIVILPFNPLNASVFLLLLVAFWSRLPGVGMPSPMLIFYYMDFVDIFSMLVAIYVGPLQGIFFTLFANYASRAVGAYPDWVMVIKDGISQSFVCMVIPFFYTMLGGNIVSTAVAYTLLRALGFFILWIIWPPWGLLKQLYIQITENGVELVIDVFYAKIFGTFFASVLNKDVKFSWLLFFIATCIILLFFIVMNGTEAFLPDKRKTKKIFKRTTTLFSKNKSEKKDNQYEYIEQIKNDLNL
jgi:predicted peroxiredoxin